ncbi:MAG: hydroxymethylbilane synthase [Acidobacteria bacterium]|nr:hydroxymethylbilane synthase [Acidobacteriota bacterium]
MEIKIGTRGSKLALWQAEHVKKRLEKAHPGHEFVIRIIKTTGDLDQKTPLNEMGGVGLFTKQLEIALDAGEIDLAVHSCKDLPSEIDSRFQLVAFLERERPLDALISGKIRLADLEKGGVVGTGSLRRVSQLKNRFPNVEIRELRGNVDTRLKKLESGEYDAIILAYAGVKRLGLESVVADVIPADIMIPAVAQGVVAVEARKGDTAISDIVSAVDHTESRAAVVQERDFLRIVEGGCKVPVGCYAEVGENFRIRGYIGSVDGKEAVRHEVFLSAGEADGAGESLARAMLADGGAEILAGIQKAEGE